MAAVLFTFFTSASDAQDEIAETLIVATKQVPPFSMRSADGAWQGISIELWAEVAKELGVKVVINTDAHSTDQLDLMKYGVITARRGWLEAKNVLNTLPLEKLRKLL